MPELFQGLFLSIASSGVSFLLLFYLQLILLFSAAYYLIIESYYVCDIRHPTWHTTAYSESDFEVVA